MLCRNCNSEISEKDLFCRFCGQKNQPENEPGLTKKCANCGKKFQPECFYCDTCGSMLVPIEQQAGNPAPDARAPGDNRLPEEKFMSFCSSCGFKIPGGMQFCGKCGARILPAKKENVCMECGSPMEEGMLFCGKCGTKVSGSAQPSPAGSRPPNNVRNVGGNTVENELYRKNLIGYYKGLTQISGQLLITSKKIVYTPLPIYVLSKQFTISMNEVLNAERASVMGINLCIRITTISGKSHMFAMGIQNSSEIQHVIDLINNARQGA
jgi:hypothetical protein